MTIKKKFRDKIYLEWYDAYTEDGWTSIEEASRIDDESLCFTNGFFLSQNKKFVVIAHTMGKIGKNSVMGVVVIPKAWIQKCR